MKFPLARAPVSRKRLNCKQSWLMLQKRSCMMFKLSVELFISMVGTTVVATVVAADGLDGRKVDGPACAEGCKGLVEGPACAEASTGNAFATFATAGVTFATAGATFATAGAAFATAGAAFLAVGGIIASAAGSSVLSSDWRAARAAGSVTPAPMDFSTCAALNNVS
jgi:hypothetical protein